MFIKPNTIQRYFEKCIMDAYCKEERVYNENEISYFFILIGNPDAKCQMLFEITTPYARVTRNATNRIERNVFKNFHISIDGDYYLSNQLDVNFTCNKVEIDSEPMYLCKREPYDESKKGFVFASGRYESLVKSYFNISDEELIKNKEGKDFHLPMDISFKEYREIYNKAFGKYPEVKIFAKSKNVMDGGEI